VLPLFHNPCPLEIQKKEIMERERTSNVWLKTAPHREEEEQLERLEDVETLTEISFIRWDRQGHHPVREEVGRSAARAVDEIAAFQIACRKGRAAPPAFPVSG
jgi:hypothetical protein